MQFVIEQRIAAPRDRVEAAYFEPAFIEAITTLPKIGRPELLEQVSDDARIRRRVRYHFAGHLSGAVRRAVDPERLSWVEETVFDRANHCSDVRVLPDHYAHQLESRMTITFDDGGDHTVRRAIGSVTVRVPLVGGRAERAIVSGMREHADAEARAVESWLTPPRQ